MPLSKRAENKYYTRITKFFTSLKSAPSSKVTSPHPSANTFIPASSGSPSINPLRRSNEQHSIQDSRTERLRSRRNFSLAYNRRARASARVKTPAQVKAFVTDITKISKGQYKSRGNQFLINRNLSWAQSQYLLSLIKDSRDEELQEYFDYKLRFDYTCDTKQFVICMPSYLHDTVARRIGKAIDLELGSIRNKSSVEDIINILDDLGPTSTSKLTLPAVDGHVDKKEPDEAWRYQHCKFPGVVMEVAWSQRKLELEDLVKRYITGSKGEIRTVIGWNLNDIYKGRANMELKTSLPTASATFSVWQAKLDDDTSEATIDHITSVLDTTFRDENGEANVWGDLTLLKGFLL